MTPSEILIQRDAKLKKLTKELKKEVEAIEQALWQRIQMAVIDKMSTEDGVVKNTAGNLRRLATIKTLERQAKEKKATLVRKALAAMREEMELAKKYYYEITGKSRLPANAEVKSKFDAKFGINKKGYVTRGALFNLVNNSDEFRGVTSAIQNAVIAQSSTTNLVRQANRAFTAAPNSFANTVNRELFTALAENERETDKTYATQLELVFYQYTGGLVNNTRDFCEERVGNVYHESEIWAWANMSWKGKSNPYNPFVDVGGYNCLHVLRPITNEMAKLRGKDIENYL